MRGTLTIDRVQGVIIERSLINVALRSFIRHDRRHFLSFEGWHVQRIWPCDLPPDYTGCSKVVLLISQVRPRSSYVCRSDMLKLSSSDLI